MITISLNIQDEVYEKVMYLLNSLPKNDVQITQKKIIEEINPTLLPKDHFDYMSSDELNELDKEIAEAKKTGFKNFKSYDEFKDEL